MLPPNSDYSPPKKLPTIERERTVISRTTPRLLTTSYPGSLSAVVTTVSFIKTPFIGNKRLSLFGTLGSERHELARADFSRFRFPCRFPSRCPHVNTTPDRLKCKLQPVLQTPSSWVARGLRTTALQRTPLSLDNNRRAALTVVALTHLVEMKRKILPSDAEGLVRFESLEQLVINGSVEDRDDICSQNVLISLRFLDFQRRIAHARFSVQKSTRRVAPSQPRTAH